MDLLRLGGKSMEMSNIFVLFIDIRKVNYVLMESNSRNEILLNLSKAEVLNTEISYGKTLLIFNNQEFIFNILKALL